jgi:hypothetical protein
VKPSNLPYKIDGWCRIHGFKLFGIWNMYWAIFEILLGLGLFIFIIWWTVPKNKNDKR